MHENNSVRKKVPLVIPLRIPGSIGYYCGDDGEIYCLRLEGDNTLLLNKLKTFFTNDRDRHKKVSLLVFGEYKVFKVNFLVASTFHGNNQSIGMNVAFKDGNFNNTQPNNLKWILNRGEYAKTLSKITDETETNYKRASSIPAV